MSTAYITTRRIGPHKRKLVYNNVNPDFLKRVYSKKHAPYWNVLKATTEDSLQKEK